MKLRFTDFTLDGNARQLLRGEREIEITPKAFDLLCILVETRPRAVSKAELQERLWPSTFVSEGNLPNLIGEIRNVLGDTAHRSRFVRTVHRYGYAFCGDVDGGVETLPSSKPVVRYWLAWGKVPIALTAGENIIGRAPGVSVWFDLHSISRRHARIMIGSDGATLEDLGSKNGTYVRGALVRSSVRLDDGDEIRIGSIVVRFRTSTADAVTQTQRGCRGTTASGPARRSSSARR
jgi:DNA-binding winged helix-turn-helix (wHTH) protein